MVMCHVRRLALTLRQEGTWSRFLLAFLKQFAEVGARVICIDIKVDECFKCSEDIGPFLVYARHNWRLRGSFLYNPRVIKDLLKHQLLFFREGMSSGGEHENHR